MPVCTSLEVTPKPKAALSVTDISVSPTSVTVGSSVTITITVRNEGNASGSGRVSVTANGGEVAAFNTGSIGAGASADFTVSWTPGSAGTFRICAEMV